MRDIENKFIDFLKEKNLYGDFVTKFSSHNLDIGEEEYLKGYLRHSKIDDYVICAFDWWSDDEKFKESLKWEKLHIEWREYIKLDGEK